MLMKAFNENMDTLRHAQESLLHELINEIKRIETHSIYLRQSVDTCVNAAVEKKLCALKKVLQQELRRPDANILDVPREEVYGLFKSLLCHARWPEPDKEIYESSWISNVLHLLREVKRPNTTSTRQLLIALHHARSIKAVSSSGSSGDSKLSDTSVTDEAKGTFEQA